jgi:hypothetical protein
LASCSASALVDGRGRIVVGRLDVVDALHVHLVQVDLHGLGRLQRRQPPLGHLDRVLAEPAGRGDGASTQHEGEGDAQPEAEQHRLSEREFHGSFFFGWLWAWLSRVPGRAC